MSYLGNQLNLKKILTLALLLGVIHVHSEETDDIAEHYAECTAYYTLVYHALNNSGDTDAATAYAKVMDDSMFYSLLLASENREQDMAVNVTNSRIEMNIKQMKEEINNDNKNISILMNKHNFSCRDAMNNPPLELVNILKRRMEELE